MLAALLPILIGLLCVYLGLQNRKGKIESLHSYHRNRVSEEDRIPFGKAVGNGNIILGISVAQMGVFQLLSALTQKESFVVIGTILLFVGMIPGFVITFKAMIKYNKGIF